MPIDPVCRMEIEEHEIADNAVYKERTYYFCSTGCKQIFDDNPAQYAEVPDTSDLEKLARTDLEEPEMSETH